MASDATCVVFPTTRTILWTPRRAGVSRAPQSRAPQPRARFCITQAALARLEQDVAAPDHPGLGFLLGSHHHCPELDLDFGVADTIVRWPRPIDRAELALPTSETLHDAAAIVVSAASRELLGWFQVCGHMRSVMSHARARAHHELLGEPWQRTLVLTPAATGPTGCFYHSESAETGFPAEFYELTAADDVGSARKRSCVTWSATYDAAEPVTLLHESVRRALAASKDVPWWSTTAAAALVPAAATAVVGSPPPELSLYGSEPTSRPPSIPFPLYVPPRDDAESMPSSRRWWQRLGAH